MLMSVNFVLLAALYTSDEEFQLSSTIRFHSIVCQSMSLYGLIISATVQRRFNGRLPLVVSLLQVYRRQQKLDGIGLYAIGFEIFQVCY